MEGNYIFDQTKNVAGTLFIIPFQNEMEIFFISLWFKEKAGNPEQLSSCNVSINAYLRYSISAYRRQQFQSKDVLKFWEE